MAYLVLVRHSISTQDKNTPAAEWGLTPEGATRCGILADKLAPFRLTQIITSIEPKARLTGELVAERLQLPTQQAENLHEHERRQTGWLSAEAFKASVKDFFAQPDTLVFGEETAQDCYQRYAGAVEQILTRYPEQNLAIVSHGTVMSLFIGRQNNIDPLPLWDGFGMPAFVVLSLPRYEVVEIVNDVMA